MTHLNRFAKDIIPFMNFKAQLSLPTANPETRVPEWQFVINLGLSVDAKVSNWPNLLPKPYWPRPTDDISPVLILSGGVWGDQCDLYPDLGVANLWNHYRRIRLALHDNILQVIEWLLLLYSTTPVCTPAQEQHRQALLAQRTRSRFIVFEMITGICRSIPFHLGSQNSFHADREAATIIYPTARASTNPSLAGDKNTQSSAIGGWFLLHVLKDIMARKHRLGFLDQEDIGMDSGIGAGVNTGGLGNDMEVIGPIGWLQKQVMRIGRIYGIEMELLKV